MYSNFMDFLVRKKVFSRQTSRVNFQVSGNAKHPILDLSYNFGTFVHNKYFYHNHVTIKSAS